MERGTHKSLIVAALALCSVAVAAQVSWLQTDIDMGLLPEADGKATVCFEAVNLTDRPVSVTSARATCGCTLPRYSAMPVAPGDTLRLEVTYDPAGRPGRFSKKVYVDISGESQTTLHIRGTVVAGEKTANALFPMSLGQLRLRETILPVGTVKNNALRSGFIEMYNTATDTLKPQVAVPHRAMHAAIVPPAIPPGEQAVLSVTVYGSQIKTLGFRTDTLTLTSEGASIPVEVTSTVEQDFSTLSEKQLTNAPICVIEPETLDFGRVAPSDKPLTRELVISNAGHDDLEIRRIATTSKALKLKLRKGHRIKRGKSATLAVELDPAKIDNPELLNTTVTIISNDPFNHTATVRAVAEIAPKP